MKKVYLASWFANRSVMRQRANDLQQIGIEVTSRWLAETIKQDAQTSEVPDSYLRETARVDIEDILLSDTVILNTPTANELDTEQITLAHWARGGRHFEAGFQYSTMVFWHTLPEHIKALGRRRLILIGHRENVFHFLDGLLPLPTVGIDDLPKIELFNSWSDAIKEFSLQK